MLIDSHCHLNYLDDPEEAVARAKEAGVTSCLCISVDEAGFSGVKALATRHDNIWATAGVHPDAAAGNLEWMRQSLPTNALWRLVRPDWIICTPTTPAHRQDSARRSRYSLALESATICPS